MIGQMWTVMWLYGFVVRYYRIDNAKGQSDSNNVAVYA
jgi:hypothetical protein